MQSNEIGFLADKAHQWFRGNIQKRSKGEFKGLTSREDRFDHVVGKASKMPNSGDITYGANIHPGEFDRRGHTAPFQGQVPVSGPAECLNEGGG